MSFSPAIRDTIIRFLCVVLVLNTVLGVALAAQQPNHGPIRGSIGREATRLALTLAASEPSGNGSTALNRSEPTAVSPITVGSRIILEAPTVAGGRVEGTVIRVDDKVLVLRIRDRAALTVSRQAIIELWVRNDGSRWLRGMGYGMLFGGTLVGSFIGMGDGQFRSSDARPIAEFLAGGAAIGAGVGAGVGALFKTHRWIAVPLDQVRPSPALNQGRGGQLSLPPDF